MLVQSNTVAELIRSTIHSSYAWDGRHGEEDQLTLGGVTYELGPPGKGGTSWDWSGAMVTGEDGIAVETLRFPN